MNGTKEQILSSPYLALVCIVAVVAVVFLAAGNSATLDAASIVYKEQTEEFQAYCTDNDPQNDYDVKGTVHMGTLKYYDFCRGSTLHQFDCSSSRSVDEIGAYDCPNGCLNGFCL